MENNLQTENNIAGMNENKQPASKKEKIIIIVLAVIFIGILLGAFWDLYGKEAMTNYLCPSQNTELSDTQTPATNPGSITLPTNKQNNSKTTENTTPTINNQNTPPVSGNDKQTKTDGATKPEQKTDSNIAYASYSTCLENTKDERAAKDCCDCLSGDASLHKACRDATVDYDFSKNTEFKTFTIPSELGPNGDYSSFTASGNQQQCKQACESTASNLACGDYQYCRKACNNLSQ